MLQQVILVEKTKFIYKMISSILQSKSIDCYVADDSEDFSFQIDELKPQVIAVNLEVIDFQWFKENIEKAKQQNFLKIGLGQNNRLDNPEIIKYFDQFVHLPIEPYEFVSQIKKWSEAN